MSRFFVGAAMAVVCFAVTGCAIHQKVTPVERLESRGICVVENPAVRAGFLESYKRSLTSKGYLVRQLPSTASVTDCDVTSTYTANWRWDLAYYMAFAEIRVFKGGQQAGQATYDSLSGSANMGKFIDADVKVNELVNQLFPGGAGTGEAKASESALAKP